MGCLRSYDEYDYLDYKCPRCGKVTELIVSKKTRSKGIGSLLMNKMEEYFKSIGCEYITIDVFAYNKIGIHFYEKHGYNRRGIIDIKKMDPAGLLICRVFFFKSASACLHAFIQ